MIFVLFLSGCSDTKTNTSEAVNDNTKEIKSKLETKTSTAGAAEDELIEIQSKIDKFIKADLNGKFSGSVLLAKNEQVLFSKGYGMADYDNKIPNTPQTSFQIGSVTKQFTATAILMLKEKGLLDIQDTIDKYIPDYPDGNKIKIYNLLNHTSGIPEYLKFVDIEQWMAGKHTYTMKELIKLFKYEPFDFEPGTNFNYSNSNYILLGYIIEKVSGMSYEDYINNNIFKPLKMEQTGMLSWRDTAKEMATGYLKIESESATKSFIMEPTLPYAAGEIYSTVEDLLI